MKILIAICFLFTVLGRGISLVLLQRTSVLLLPYDYPVGASFHRLQALDEKSGQPPEEILNFYILKILAFPRESKSGRGLFIVDEHTGSLMLSPHRRHSISEFRGSTFALDIATTVSTQPSEDAALTTVAITITDDNFTIPDCSPREDLCFSSTTIYFQIPETIREGSVFGDLRPIPYTKLCPQSSVKYTFPFDDNFPVILESTELKTRHHFDFEEDAYHEWNVSCEVRSMGENDTFYARVKTFILDVDDNPPYIQNSTDTYQELDVAQISPGNPLPIQLTILDPDSPSVNRITVNKTDPLKLFHLRDPVVFHGVNGAHMLMNTALVPKSPFQFPDVTYNVSVVFNDTALVRFNESGLVVFHILISNKSSDIPKAISPPNKFQVSTNIFRHTAQHTRVIQPMEVKPHEGYFFRLLRNPNKGILSNRIFGVTPVTGIVYVNDEVALSRSTNKLFHLELTWRNKNVTDSRCVILVRVLDSGEPNGGCGIESGHQFPPCAIHGTAEACSTSCGKGASGGFCQWRSQSSPTLVDEYATCSPNLQTCPDGTCDELEGLDPFLCPQDCAENVRGEAVPGTDGKGVGKSAAPCTCAGPNTCICAQFFASSKLSHQPVSRSQTKNPNNKYLLTPPNIKGTSNIKSQPLELSKSWGSCGAQCTTMIVVVSLIVSGLIAAAGFLTYRRWRSRPKGEELSGVKTPVNSSTYLLARGTIDYPMEQNILREAKLEFPRDHLVLEETLGEGEFGKVVKGRAKNIAGLPGTTTVAVKMLKDGSSSSERRDLVSELNLLKEISHPNVIRLLGASTDENGQLYIIMEYAEHGSLISYLRRLKSNSVEVPVHLPELIAFALQISKGMNYLAGMKVVHRDLAARNVLVASGKVLKISDFGLSRDVYEGETYLKTSKGKVPVKWMALESLENQIYTTKSDVWSFGILLWEIITIGGCPYPGIPTERLFQLLKDGYRMLRPDSCPLQLYEIMRACWLEKPHERPHFKELVQKIECVLEDIAHPHAAQDEMLEQRGKRFRNGEDGSKLQQLTSFPRLAVQQVGPYENQCLLSSNEFSV